MRIKDQAGNPVVDIEHGQAAGLWVIVPSAEGVSACAWLCDREAEELAHFILGHAEGCGCGLATPKAVTA